MYSRFNDKPRAPAGAPPAGMPSYRQRVRVPPGYKGLASVDGEERLPGTEPARDTPPAEGSPHGVLPENRDFGHDAAEPRFDGLDRVSELPNRDKIPLPVAYTPQPSAQRKEGGGLFDLSHFPFGHGLGTEEWLLIGLIFLLLREAGPDRGDLDETVLLLGLLLLGG